MKNAGPPSLSIEKSILLIRSRKVLLDEDLGRLYGVSTSALVQAVKRNLQRFPSDFMFQLTTEEYSLLRSQIVISRGRIGRRYPPYVFTELGVAMLSSVLGNERAIAANIEIMRTFVRLRELMASHGELAEKINALEKRFDAQFKVVFNSIRELINTNAKDVPRISSKKRAIGFGRDG